MVNEHTVDCNPSPSELNLRIYLLIFLWTPKGFISPEYFWRNIPVYPTMVVEKFQIYSVKITDKYICESKKLNLFIFAHAPKHNLPQVFIITPG